MTYQGKVVFQNGSRIPLTYQLASEATDGLCHGSLLGEVDRLDPALTPGRLTLVCEDGRTIDLLITHVTTKGATFVGTILDDGVYGTSAALQTSSASCAD
jgi:3-deoxy-D-arabino-heptulosonate 7-phosphate (DAHP) synthase class II